MEVTLPVGSLLEVFPCVWLRVMVVTRTNNPMSSFWELGSAAGRPESLALRKYNSTDTCSCVKTKGKDLSNLDRSLDRSYCLYLSSFSYRKYFISKFTMSSFGLSNISLEC